VTICCALAIRLRSALTRGAAARLQELHGPTSGQRLREERADAPARLSPAFERRNRALEGISACSERSNPAHVMSLKNKGDFLMHGVVLQIRVFQGSDVSRETVFTGSARSRCFT